MSKITSEENSELFELQVRGGLADAFAYSGMSPDAYWPLLRGEREITLRDIGEVSAVTGFNMTLQLSRRPDDAELMARIQTGEKE